MKVFNIICLAGLLTVLFASSCNKDVNLIDENNMWVLLDSANSANVKFIQVFAGNTPQIPTAAHDSTGPQVFIYANGAKLNGTSLSYGGVWPATTAYANIPSGNTVFHIINGRMNLAVVPNVPKFNAGDTLATFTVNLDKGKFYSFYIGDTVTSVRVTVKEDNLVTPLPQTYKIRLANFSMNNNPTDTFTLYSARQGAEIITDITHKNVSDWVQLPIPILNDTLVIRKKGTTATYTFGVIAPAPLRMYTIIGRGKTGLKNKRPSTTIITNR